MKTIGIIGGLSWQSTAQYYQHLNQQMNDKLGGLHSAKINLHSVDFAEIVTLLNQNDWPSITKKLMSVAQAIEASKADLLMVTNNTLHNVADDVAQAINIPLLHIADVMAEQLLKDNIRHVGLLGTIPTMELGFYKTRLKEKFAINVITPAVDDRAVLHDIIFNELCVGIFTESTKNLIVAMINKLQQRGAKAILLACTELPLIIKQSDTVLPIYDSCEIHSQAAVNLAITDLK